MINQVAANPMGAVADQNQLSAFQGQLNDVYGGPSNWADLGTQQGKAAEAQQYGGLTKTPGGTNVLTQQVEQQLNPGQTSQGINQLDTMLLGGNPNAMQTVQSAADPYSTLNDYINQQNTNITGAIGQGQTAAAQASQDALNAFTGANGTYTNLNNVVNQQSADALAQAQAQQAALKADIGNLYGGQTMDTGTRELIGYGGADFGAWGNNPQYNVGQLSPETLASMGITQDQWNALQSAIQTAGTPATSQYYHNFGAERPTTQMDLMSYLNQQDPTQMINAANTATPEQYAQMAAIQQLLGSKTPQGAAINPLNASLAGTYNPANLNNFNYQQALQDVQNYNTQAQQASDEMTKAIVGNADLQHAQSQHGGGVLGGIVNDFQHPGNIITSVINPMSWGANIQNVAKGQPVGGQHMNPISPQSNTVSTLAHGGEVPEIDEYLDSKKVK